MTEKDRRGASNGIWLCETCAKLIDSDLPEYSRELLLGWKVRAEQKAKAQIGKTKAATGTRSRQASVKAIKREHRLRDDLHRDLLKSPPERMSLARFSSRAKKFAHSEVIVHRIDDTSYPEHDKEGRGISGWFKLEILDFYHGGLHGILDIECVLLDSASRGWSVLSHDQEQLPFAARFRVAKSFKTGKIPWRNILHYDMEGDEYYPQPHIYCEYADAGMPYEGYSFFLLGDGYEHELYLADRLELSELLASAQPKN